MVREVLMFLVKVGFIFVLWRLFSSFIGNELQPLDERVWPWLSAKWEAGNDLLRIVLLKASAFVTELLGYEAEVVNNYVLKAKGYGGISVGNYCLGIQLMALYSVLILSYPAAWSKKVGYLLFGLLFIQAINVGRIVGLNLLSIHWPGYLDFNHHFTFRAIVFSLILLLYYRFVDKSS